MKSHALHLNRSLSHDVTEAILVYKTMKQRPGWCTKNFCRIELISYVNYFFCYKK